MAGYSSTPLLKKLGYTEAQAKWLIAPPSTLLEISGFAGAKVSKGPKFLAAAGGLIWCIGL
jgi:hypothetical protein